MHKNLLNIHINYLILIQWYLQILHFSDRWVSYLRFPMLVLKGIDMLHPLTPIFLKISNAF